MATHDYVIDNQSASAFRADLNNALQAIVTQNSNATAPTTTYANMVWYDTAANQLKKRNEANSAWIVLGTIDEALGTFTPSGGGVIASQAEAEAGTNNTNLMTPLRTAQAITALAGLQNIDVRTTTGSFTVPSGVTRLYIFAVGGGGGGGGAAQMSSAPGTQYSGGGGGIGGGALSSIPVTPGASISYTIGAGGVGTNTTSANGTNGGTTTVDTISCTGGVGGFGATTSSDGFEGANGTGSGGNLANNVYTDSLTKLTLGLPILDDVFSIQSQRVRRLNGTSLTAAIDYSFAGANGMGVGGSGESTTTSSNASGGVGGAVVFMY